MARCHGKRTFPLKKVLQTQLERCKRKSALRQQELSASEDASRYRLQAELLLAYQHEVKQGQSNVVLQNFFENEAHPSEITIPLDPRFDAVGNANRLFHKYHKLRRALALVPDQIEKNAVEQATVEQLLADMMLADTPAEAALVKSRGTECWLYPWSQNIRVCNFRSAQAIAQIQRWQTKESQTSPTRWWRSSAYSEP